MIGQLLNLTTRDARARSAELLERFDPTDAAGRVAKTYSGGTRRRLDLAASLVGRPHSRSVDRSPRRRRSSRHRWYLVLCIVTLGFGMMMGFRVETNAMAATAGFGISLAFALCFCWISMFVGMKVRTSGAVRGVVFLIVLPLSFASNTFATRAPQPAADVRQGEPHLASGHHGP